jgi:AraC-like DNA-binding protein
MRRPDTCPVEVHFSNPRLAPVGVEVLTLSRLKERAPRALLAGPQRVDFHHILVMQRGRARHTIDLQDHELTPGSVAMVQPGQIQRWDCDADAEALVLLVAPEALAPTVLHAGVDAKLLALGEWPAVSRLDARILRRACVDIARMHQDLEDFVPGELAAAIIRHELLMLLLRLTREVQPASPPASSGEAEVFRMFSRELDRHFMERWGVQDYAKRIGYSESTLSRACVAAVGRTAKQEIDERVALEAKRLLSHSEAAVACIGRRLGFTEPTNFVKFFKRMSGATPHEFRERSRHFG